MIKNLGKKFYRKSRFYKEKLTPRGSNPIVAMALSKSIMLNTTNKVVYMKIPTK